MFPSVECIVYGHTHRAAQTTIGSVLLVNPGSFASTGRFGAPGTYAILTVDGREITATLHELPVVL